jgi:hypothetical protein
VTIPLWGGHKLELGRTGEVDFSGELPSKNLSINLPSFSPSIDIPFAPGAYATASLEIAPQISLNVSGGTYSIRTGSEQTVALSITGAGITGKMGLEITARLGVGTGVANVVGLEAGLFGALEGSAELSGALGGTATFGASNDYNLDLDLAANADIVGKAGAYVRAKVLHYPLTKEASLVEKTFAHFSYERKIQLGRSQNSWKPALTDFAKKDYGNHQEGKVLEIKTVDGEKYNRLTDEED